MRAATTTGDRFRMAKSHKSTDQPSADPGENRKWMKGRVVIAVIAVVAAVLVRSWIRLRRAVGEGTDPGRMGDPSDALRPA